MTAEFSTWRKATKSADGNGGCVEWSFSDGVVAFRDSKLGDDSPVLVFSDHELDCFIDAVVNGEVTRPA